MGKIFKILGIILGIMICMCVVFFAGRYYEYKDNLSKAETYETVNTIAVVNLDEGTTVNDEMVNYSEDFIKFPDTNFISTGLEEAKYGLENGQYGAYIIIPADFSKSIESINSVPQKSVLEYAINNKLRSDINIDVVQDIEAFQNNLNANISYVYLASILDEFHGVQDDATSILANNGEVLTAVEDIDSEQLITGIEFSEMKMIDNTVENVDLSANSTMNTQIMSELNLDIKDKMNKGIADYAMVQSNNVEINTDKAELFTAIGKLDPLVDENGKAVYSTGVTNLKAAIDLYNSNNSGKIPTIGTQLTAVANSQKDKDKTYMISELNSMVDAAQDDIDGIKEDSQTKIQDYVDMELGKIQTANQKTVNDQLTTYINTQTTAYGTIQTNLNTEANTQLAAIVNENHEDYRAVYLQLMMLYINDLEYLKSSILKNEPISSADLNDKILYLQNMNFDALYTNQTSDETLADNSIVLTIADKDKLFPKNENFQVNPAVTADKEDKEATDIYIDVTKVDLSNLKVEFVANDVKFDNLDEAFLTEKSTVINNLYSVPKDGIENVINTDIIGPISAENAKELKELKDLGEDLNNSYTSYEANLKSYNPYKYINENSFVSYVNRIESNGEDMINKTNEKNEEYLSFINDVYDNADENISLLQEDMSTSNEGTKSKIVSSIDNVKKVQTTNYSENAEMLNAFTEKLPYTRLGSVDYTEVYDFIVRPTENQSTTVKIVKSTEEKKTTTGYSKYIWIGVLGLLGILNIIVVYMITSDKSANKDKREKRRAYRL